MKLKLVCNQCDLTTAVYCTEGEHEHGPRAERGIGTEIGNQIEELFDSGVVLPNNILSQLRNRGIIVEKPKLNSFLVRLKKRKGEGNAIELGQVIDWCSNNKEIPISADEVFVANFEINSNIPEPVMRIFITTKRLVQMASYNGVHVCTDLSYKLVWQGYPVIIVGTTDMTRQFHPFGMAVCTNEGHEDYAFIFNSLKMIVQQVCGFDYEPTVLIAGDSLQITTGFRNSFATLRHRVVCWDQVGRSIDKHLNLISTQFNQVAIKSDIVEMQLSANLDVFNTAVRLFNEKWCIEERFLAYFNLEWVVKLNGWFKGYTTTLKIPSLNDGLDIFKRAIKDQFGSRMPVEQFFELLRQNLVHNWSVDRDPQYLDAKLYATTVEYSQDDKLKANQWLQKKKQNHASGLINWIPSASNLELNLEDVELFRQMRNGLCWKSCDAMFKLESSMWCVVLEESDWKLGKCSCPFYGRNWKCKHVLALSSVMKLVDAGNMLVLPTEATNGINGTSVGQKRKRGAPTKSQKAQLI